MAPWHSGHALDLFDLGPGLDPRRSHLVLFETCGMVSRLASRSFQSTRGTDILIR